MPGPKEKLQYINNLLSKFNLDGFNRLNEEDIETLSEEYLDSSKHARAARAEKLKKIADKKLGENMSLQIPEGADPLTYLFLDYRGFDTKDQKSIERYNRGNVEIINKFADPNLNPADKKALYENKFRNLLGVNFKTITTGTDDEKVIYLHNAINSLIAFPKVPELIEEYKKIPGYNRKTVEALEEKLGLFHAAADYMEYASIYSHPGYKIAEKITPQQLKLIKENDEVKLHMNSQTNDEEWTSNLEFIDTLSRRHEKTEAAERFLALGDIFEKLADQQIIDNMDDAVAYVAFDEENNRIDIYKAAQMMQSGKTITFRERTFDAINYIINHSVDEVPKKEFTGRFVEFQGKELKRTVDEPNPVLETLAKLPPEEELAAAKLWFDDMLVNIKEKGSIDPEQKYDTFRFKEVDLGGRGRQNVIKDEFIGMPQPEDPLNYDLDSSIPLKDFNDEQKLTMFKAAREGRLVLNAPSMFIDDAKGIYVNKDGKFGITAPIGQLTTENNTLDEAIKGDKDFLKKSIPGADNALQIATQLGDFIRASKSDLGINSNLPDELRLKKQAEKVYESLLLKDIAENPQFYKEKNIRDARTKLITNNVKGSSDPNLSENDSLAVEAQRHDPSAYRGIVNTIAPLINNSLVAQGALNGVEKISPDDAIKKYADMGLITIGKGRNTPIMNEPNDMPWDLVDRIDYHMGDGAPIYITTASDGKIRDYKLSYSGEKIKIKEVMPLKTINEAQEEITRLREQLNQTGTTRGDSEEFKKLSTFLNSKSFNPVPESREDFMKAMKTLSQLSFDYSFAKLDQSQNTRRKTRFETACQLQNIADALIYGESPLDSKELSKKIIASKAAKELLGNMAKSKDARTKAFAQASLKSKTAFNEQLDILMGSGSFISHFDNLGAEQLSELSNNSASSLAKKVIDAKSGYKHDIIGECFDKINAANITLGSNTAVVNSYMSGFMAAKDNPHISSQEVAVNMLNGNPYGKAASREGISSLAICCMLSKGCSFEDAFNPKLFKEEKQLAFNDVFELLKNKTPENTRKIAGYYKAAMDAGVDYFNKKAENIDFSNPAWIASGDNWKLSAYTKFMQSVIQEYESTEELKTEFQNLYKTPGKNDGEEKALASVNLQVFINEFVIKGTSSLKIAYDLENGINDPLSEKSPVQSPQISDQFVQSKIYRESYMQAQMQGADMKPSEIINQIRLKMSAAGNFTARMQLDEKIDKKILNIINDPGKARAIGKDFIDGNFDKNYSVKDNPDNPAQGFKTVGFSKALDSIKPVKLPASVLNAAPRKKEEIVEIKF